MGDNEQLHHPPASRGEPFRSRPEELRTALGEIADKFLKACRDCVVNVKARFIQESHGRWSQHATDAQRDNRIHMHVCMAMIAELMNAPVNMQAEVQKSTCWVPDWTRMISMPSGINDCTCAGMAKFPDHISLDCHGLEM